MHAFSHLIARTTNYLSKWKSSGLIPLENAISSTENNISLLKSLDSFLDHNDLNNLALRALYNKHSVLE